MYSLVDRFRTSLVAKVFRTCFVSIHLPLISLAMYLGYGQPSDPLPVLLTALVATLLGCALSFVIIKHFLSPIDRITHSLERYRSDGVPPALESPRHDEMGKLAQAVEILARDQDTQMRLLRRQANSDPLTGLGNRRWLKEAAKNLFVKAARQRRPITIILFDLDHFKQINDTHGHSVGDEVLSGVAQIAQNQIRADDLLARIGGEEFCIVICDDGIDRPSSAAARLRSAIEDWQPAFATDSSLGGCSLSVTASFGVYSGDPAAETLREMIKMADVQLYQAKAMGRNLVVFQNAADEA